MLILQRNKFTNFRSAVCHCSRTCQGGTIAKMSAEVPADVKPKTEEGNVINIKVRDQHQGEVVFKVR